MRNYQFVSARSKDVKFDEFKNIERNIKREILDYSSTEESPSVVMNDSRSDGENVASSGETLSLEGDDSSPVDMPSDYKALMNVAAESKVFAARTSEETIGDQIMDRKRLRVF